MKFIKNKNNLIIALSILCVSLLIFTFFILLEKNNITDISSANNSTDELNVINDELDDNKNKDNNNETVNESSDSDDIYEYLDLISNSFVMFEGFMFEIDDELDKFIRDNSLIENEDWKRNLNDIAMRVSLLDVVLKKLDDDNLVPHEMESIHSSTLKFMDVAKVWSLGLIEILSSGDADDLIIHYSNIWDVLDAVQETTDEIVKFNNSL